MGYVVPLPPMRHKGMHCPACGSERVDRIYDFWTMFDISDRRECLDCKFRSRKPEKFYMGDFGTLKVINEIGI